MHVVCLGVMKALLGSWIKVKNRNYSLQQNDIRKLNTEFQSIARYIPRDLCRKPRDLKEIDCFKATEFRQFLLYTGQVVLKDILSEERYIHFLQLSLAMRILLNAEDCVQNNKCAEERIKDFLLRVPVLYDDLMLTYNCHCLSHLARDSKHFGSLETTSAFNFENKLGKIKKLVKKNNNVPSQIYNRLVEQSLHGNHHTNIVSKKSTIQSDGIYKFVKTKNFYLSSIAPENFYLVQKLIFKLISISRSADNDFVLHGLRVQDLHNLYNKPLQSSLFNIYRAENLSFNKTPNHHTLDEVTSKCLCFYTRSSYIFVPLIADHVAEQSQLHRRPH
ncbi:uncharacterized protein LOC125777367 [Bactrocera dorsalis]|uniref:Uncharacterized protein LOC125777367 n=1 Tax=Bactrocera dorsalis TaxID=27457 RepID=A0ABM3JFT9_BACDO|nr:uncharacterized protein LOC125777367 [Bactrocera dorsalis]